MERCAARKASIRGVRQDRLQEVGEQQVGDAELAVGVGEAPARRLEADLVVAVRRRVRRVRRGRGQRAPRLAPRAHHRVQLRAQRPRRLLALVHLRRMTL